MSPRFSIIPAGAVTDSRIEPRDLQVLCLLGRHIDDLGWCRRSQVRMAKELSCARSTVQASLDRLIAAEWVQKRPEPKGPQGDTAHSYRVRLDHDENDAFYRDAADLGRGRKGGKSDSQNENTADSSAPPPPADLSAPPLPPQERHPVPTYGSAPVTSPVKREDSREARAREGEKPGWDFQPPDDTLAKATFDALALAWRSGATGGAGAIGDSAKALAALMDLPEADHPIAIERAPRFLRSLKDAKRSYTMAIATYVENREFDQHPPPANADPGRIAPVALGPFTLPLWAMFWKAFHKARQGGGDAARQRRLQDCLGWIERGASIPAASLPSEDETQLEAIKVDSDEFRAWQDFATRCGVRLPVPNQVPVIFVPAAWPPTLNLIGAKPYWLAAPVRVEFRSPLWWWRFFKRLEDGSAIVTGHGAQRLDHLEHARRRHGSADVDYGPIPLSAELASMVEIRTLTPEWEAWSNWAATRGGDLDMWPHGSIWAPSREPSGWVKTNKAEGAAA